MPLPVSIVIPALNTAPGLADTLAGLAGSVAEIIVADGGSDDGTAAVAERFGAQVVRAERGRGVQLAAGAAAAAQDWLFFLHADTKLQPGWQAALSVFITDPANRQRAAYFGFCLDDAAPSARRVERLVAWRCRRFGLPYGDQGLLIHREFYESLGGFQPVPLMEDVDLIRRIGRRRLTMLPVDAVTSATRYRRDGYWRRPMRNLTLLSLYFLGVPPRWLVRAYG